MTYLPKVFVDFLSQTKIHGKIKQASRGVHVARVRPLVPMASYITGFKQYLVDRSNHVISVCFNFDSIQDEKSEWLILDSALQNKKTRSQWLTFWSSGHSRYRFGLETPYSFPYTVDRLRRCTVNKMNMVSKFWTWSATWYFSFYSYPYFSKA